MRVCKNTKTVKGCGETKPDNEFKIVRVNQTTGKVYRERICAECRKKSRRKPKKIMTEAGLYNQFDRLMRR